MQFAEETALVSNVVGDFVLIETQNNPNCDQCSSKSGCGSLSSFFSFKPRNKLRIKNTLGLNKGDTVVVSMANDRLLLATALMYLSPLILLFILSLIAKLLFGETASIVAGLTGLFFGMLIVKRVTQRDEIAKKFQPKLIRKIIKVEVA